MLKFADWREKAILEENTARVCGYEAGIKDGIEQNTYELVKKMLLNGENIEKIQLYSGCGIDEIEKIKDDLASTERHVNRSHLVRLRLVLLFRRILLFYQIILLQHLQYLPIILLIVQLC